MPDARRAIVTNTTPLIALAAGTGGLEILRALYDRVIVPFEVADELHAAGGDALGVAAFEKATWLERRTAAIGTRRHTSGIDFPSMKDLRVSSLR